MADAPNKGGPSWPGLHEAYEDVPPWLGFAGETRGKHPKPTRIPMQEFSQREWQGGTYPEHQWSDPVEPYDVSSTMNDYSSDIGQQRALQEAQAQKQRAPSGLVLGEGEREILERDPYGQWYLEGEEAVYQPDATMYGAPNEAPVQDLGSGQATGESQPITPASDDEYMELAELISAEPDMQKRMEALIKLSEDNGLNLTGDDIIAIVQMSEQAGQQKSPNIL